MQQTGFSTPRLTPTVGSGSRKSTSGLTIPSISAPMNTEMVTSPSPAVLDSTPAVDNGNPGLDLMFLAPGEEETLEKLMARLSFHEATAELLRREVPKYCSSLSDEAKVHQQLSRVLSQSASSEPCVSLQGLLFAYSQVEQRVADSRATFRDQSTLMKDVLDEWHGRLIDPLRAAIDDYNTNVKPKEGEATSSTSADDELEVGKERLQNALLPVHARMFERHRIKAMLSLMRSLLLSQIASQVQAIEDYSALLESLADVEVSQDAL